MSCTRFIRQLPNENSFVGKPEAERAATGADGPGIGMTGIFLSTHNFAYIVISHEDYYISSMSDIFQFQK